MSEPEEPSGVEGTEPQEPDWAPGAVCVGIRVWTVNGTSQQELVERVGLLLGEHMLETDELHVSYNAMQSGHQLHPRRGALGGDQSWSELFFEWSALIVLRPR